MDARALRYFVAVYEEGSISAAAKRAFVAQPSISTAIAQLEEEVGAQLFVRHKKGVTPTPEGRTFYGSVKRILGEFTALKDLFKTPKQSVSLSLAIMPTVDSRSLEEMIRLLADNDSALSLRLVGLAEKADARLVSDRLLRKGERFLHLWDENYVLAIPASHRLSLKPVVSVDDLHGVRFVERCLCELHDEVARYLARHKVKPVTVARAENEEWASALVSAGLGVALVPESSVNGKDGVVTRTLDGPKLIRKVGLAYDPTEGSKGLRIALDLIRTRRTRLRLAG